MAIISCPECGGALSTKAAFCPHCGYAPTPEEREQAAPEERAEAATAISEAETVPPSKEQTADASNPLKEALKSSLSFFAPQPKQESQAETENSEQPDKPRPSLPSPILDARELSELEDLTLRYEKLVEPGFLAKLGGKVAEIVPAEVREGVGEAIQGAGKALTEQELYAKALEQIGKGYDALNQQVARFTVSRTATVNHLNGTLSDVRTESIDEFCLLRSYDVAKAANDGYLQHSVSAFLEGGGFGAMGIAGIPGNLVVSTLLYYRAVQCVAISYGFDAKEDPGEQVIASQVLADAFNPTDPTDNRMTNEISKFMALGATLGVGAAAKKGWAAMIEKGGPALLIAQIRALANKAAAKALNKAGMKGLENAVMKELLEQVGKKLTLKAVQRAVPLVGAGIGAFMDLAQMNTVIEYADVFYHKRFLIEKEMRVQEFEATA